MTLGISNLSLGLAGNSTGISAAFTASISGLTSGRAQTGVLLTGAIAGLVGGETVVHVWTEGGTPIGGATASTFTPTIGGNVSDLGLLRYAPTVDGTEYASAAATIAYAAGSAAGALGDQSWTVDAAISTLDPTGDFTLTNLTVTWSATGLPTGLSINSGTGAITGTPTVLGTGSSVVVIATDQYGRTVSSGFSADIVEASAAPVLSGFSIDDTADDITVTTDVDATIYWLRTPTGPEASAADIRAGTGTDSGSFAATAAGSPVTENITFAAGTDGVQRIDLVAQVGTGTLSNVVGGAITIDTVAPTLVPASCTPADGATGVAIDSNITLIFSETVLAGSGNFTIYDTSGPTLVETIAVGAATIGTTDVVLNPVSDLSASTSYSIRWEAGVVADAAGNDVAVNATDTLLNFTTTSSSPTLYDEDYSGTTDAYEVNFDAERIFQANDGTPITITHNNTGTPNASLTAATDGRIILSDTTLGNTTTVLITIKYAPTWYSSIFITARPFTTGATSSVKSGAFRWLQSDKSTQTGSDFNIVSGSTANGFVAYNGSQSLGTVPGDAGYLQIELVSNFVSGETSSVQIHDLTLVV